MLVPHDPVDTSSASTVFVRTLADGVSGHGIDTEGFLRATGIDPVLASDPHGRIGLRELCRLFERALELTGDEALGLHLAERTTEAAFGLFAHLTLHAPTIRESVAVMLQFGSIALDRGPVVLVERGREALLRYDFVRCAARADRMFAEFCMAGLLRLLRQYAGQSASPERVCFQHARPEHHQEYARIFGGRERFEQGFTGMSFASELLDRRPIHLHSKLYSVLRAEAESALDRSRGEASHSERVLSFLQSRPPNALPDMEETARALGTSARSLQRRLTDERTSFRTLRQRALENAAAHLLGDPRCTLQEIAFLMGFANVSAFYRAFKRWKGKTPQGYRGALREP